MHGIVTTYLHSPSLDQLNTWGNLDSLPFSLDSAYWAEADIFRLRLEMEGKGRARMLGRRQGGAGTRASGKATARLRPLLRKHARLTAEGRGAAHCEGVVLNYWLCAVAHSAASCSGLFGAQRSCPAIGRAKTRCQGHFGAQRSCRARGRGRAACACGLRMFVRARASAKGAAVCRPELRGHGWRQSPEASPSVWTQTTPPTSTGGLWTRTPVTASTWTERVV